MDILSEAGSVARARWDAGETATESDAQRLERLAIEKNPGWQLASIYSYHCYDDYQAYCVVLWQAKGEQNGYALVGLRVCLFEKENGEFVLKKVKRMA